MTDAEVYTFRTLPDYLRPDLRLVFVGLNPGIYSAQRGHYFARRTNRFWPALSRSRLSLPIREALGREELVPEDDYLLLEYGIGFTDVVKIPTHNAAELKPANFQEWAPRLLRRLERYQPRVACFHGVTAFGNFMRYGLGLPPSRWDLGPQEHRPGIPHLYVVPNPSPANAHYSLQDQIDWYDRLADYLESL